MAGTVPPVAKTLFLCEEVDTEWGKTNLYGFFNILRPAAYPHVVPAFAAFVQLGQGLGEVRFHIDISRAWDGRLVHTSTTRVLQFRDRAQVLEVAVNFTDVWFDEAGVYLVEVFCDNVWVGDVTLQLVEVGP